MSFLTEPLKTTVTVDGMSYPVNTDFRVWLGFYELIAGDKPDFEGMVKAIIMCYKGGKLPPSFFEAFNALLAFFSGYCEPAKQEKTGKKVFDFAEDAELIFASFMSDYGIDLSCENLHWHKFLALFKGLSAESAFMKVVALRSINPAEIKDRKYRDEIIKKQKIFALFQGDACEKFAEDLMKIM